MERLPFDPNRAKGAAKPARKKRARKEQAAFGSVADAEQLTVSQLTGLIKETLEQRLPSSLRVIGQISNMSARNHWYFSLKDEEAVVGCVAWASTVKRFGFEPSDGDEVVATGHVTHYPPQGRTQFYVTNLKPVGAGALELRFRALCEELRSKGYFDPSRKKRLPILPRKVAVITSASGAAVRDVIATAGQRCPAVGLVIVDTPVQGEGASERIARGIAFVDREHETLGIDAILVTRGGGSLEDLWAFNERVVADATLNCSIPIVAAIGHESDTTLIELIADLRAATPTQAAMHLVPDRGELLGQVSHLQDRLGVLAERVQERARVRLERASVDLLRMIQAKTAQRRLRLERLAGRLAAWHPGRVHANQRATIAVLADRLSRAVRHRHQRGHDRLAALSRELDAIGPLAVLHRGYSLTEDRDGRLVRSGKEVSAGDLLVTRLAEGSVESIVVENGKAQKPSQHERHPPKPGKPQMDLFGSDQ